MVNAQKDTAFPFTSSMFCLVLSGSSTIHGYIEPPQNHRNDKGLEYLSCEEMLRELELFNMEKRGVYADKYKTGENEGQNRLFSVLTAGRTRRNGGR